MNCASLSKDNEIRTGSLGGYIFVVPCLVVSAILFYLSVNETGYLFVGLFFLIGVVVGVRVIFWPMILIRVTKRGLQLYPGYLIRNRVHAVVPLEKISDFSVEKVRNKDTDDGWTWVLTLKLMERVKLDPIAVKYIQNTIRFSELSEGDDWTLHWELASPRGGAKKLEFKLRKLFDHFGAAADGSDKNHGSCKQRD